MLCSKYKQAVSPTIEAIYLLRYYGFRIIWINDKWFTLCKMYQSDVSIMSGLTDGFKFMITHFGSKYAHSDYSKFIFILVPLSTENGTDQIKYQIVSKIKYTGIKSLPYLFFFWCKYCVIIILSYS